MPRRPFRTKRRPSRRDPSPAAPKGRVLAQPAGPAGAAAGRALGSGLQPALPRQIAPGAQIQLGVSFLTLSVCLRWRR